MSHANKSKQPEINGDNYFVNDSHQISNPASGASEYDHDNKLHDHSIEEEDKKIDHIQSSKNEENDKRPELLNFTIFHLIKENSMAIYYGWQLVCLIIFLFTAYETLQNVLPKAEKYPEPKRFFSSDSFIVDYPHGNLGTVQSKVANSELSLVIFYAPWSSDCQHARTVLQTISKVFYREVDFFSINCWQPDGECRQQYKKVMSWPVLMAYSRNNIAIPYNGQWTETAVARFIYLMLRPLHRINKPEELLAVIHNHDAVVTLFVNVENSLTFYNIFYQAAIKWLERDPYGHIAFTVVTGDAMNSFGVDKEPTLRLYLWNRTVEYENDVWKASLIHKWLIQNKQQITHWLSPPGSRSKEFETFIRKGPVLVLFTPRNLYDFSSDAYAMLRQIAYEYNSCENGENGEWLKEMGRNYIFNQRKISVSNYDLQMKECEKFSLWKNSAENKCASFDRISFVGLTNSTNYKTVDGRRKSDDYCEKIPQMFDQNYVNPTFFSLDELTTSIVDTKNDLRSSENIFNEWKDIKCKMMNLSKKLRSKIFQDPILSQVNNASQFNFHQITGFACKTNKTLSFLAMDSLNYGLIAEKLGVSLKSIAHNTAAVIIDSEDESSYVLNDTLTTSNFIDFVYNYSTKKLLRHLRNDGEAKHSHFYRPKSQSVENYDPNVGQLNSKRKFEPITITTISSENFTSFICDPDRTVAVLFLSSQCAFCTIFSSILLTISKILSLDNADYLKIARIDSDKNDLPWQYTMETVPAFIVFNDKLDSRKYPASMKVTVKNVLGFILSNLTRPNRLKAIASILRNHLPQQSIESVIIALRRETEDSLIESLRAWRLHPRKRNYILRRIQALRQLYFSLHTQAYNRDLKKIDELIKNVLAVWLHKASVQ